MDKLIKALHECRDALLKGTFMPSIKAPKMPSINAMPTPSTPKTPSLAPSSKKNPVKVAEQVQDESIKPDVMQGAKERLKLFKNGQWAL